MLENLKNLDKRVWVIIVLIIVIVLVLVLYAFLIRKSEEPTEKTMEEILSQLTASEGTADPISDELQKSLSAPEDSAPSEEELEDVLNKLTAPK